MAIVFKREAVDDIDGESPADSLVRFSIDGKDREIHLTKEHADQLRELLKPWVKASRPSSGKKTTTTRSPEKVALLREWAAANGWQFDRGRPKRELIEAYVAATGNTY